MEFEIWETARCALSVAKTLNPGSPAANKLGEWLGDDGVEIGIDLSNVEAEEDSDTSKNPFGYSTITRVTPKQWRQGIEALATFVEQLRPEGESPFQSALSDIAGELGLDGLEEKILGAFVRYSRFDVFMKLCDQLVQAQTLDADAVLARMFDTRASEVQARLSRERNLFRLGLLAPPSRMTRELPGRAELPDAVNQALSPPNKTIDDFRRSLIGEPCRSELEWDDFVHLKDGRDFILEILRGALRSGEKGVNILLYGPPGTGKTEFAKIAAHMAGVPIYSVGEADEEGADPSAHERLASYKLASALLAGRPAALLLFDEMEDLLGRTPDLFGNRAAAASKVFLNRLLENNLIPTVWTTNSIESFDPALRRRLTFALEMPVPPKKIREKVWHKVLEKEQVSLSSEEVARLAKDFPDAPALASSAVRAAKLAGATPERIRLAISSVTEVIHGRSPTDGQSSERKPYDLSLLNTSTDLDLLTEKVCALKESRRVSFCLSGPPGTGKSAFVRHLAEKMGLEVLIKRTSDLLSMWVGGSERNIAAAFREARDEEAFLVFDEADSLLQDRNLAIRSWEITQVNEMLTWMESHDYPFACTTNFTDRLDPASLRRFTFKVSFGFLKFAQCESAFRLYFRTDPPDELRLVGNLTPGDFSVVARKAGVLGCCDDPLQIFRMLREEAEAKQERRPTGFMA